MKPFITLARVATPDGAELTLQEHDGQHYLKLNGRQLMSTSATLSELLLGELACARLRSSHAAPRVLIGGLGFGFTLRAVLHALGAEAAVEVAELIPEVIAWNRDLLAKVNGTLLDDPRVKVFPSDVFSVIKHVPRGKYDAILLDLDDGPVGYLQGKKSYKYDYRGCGRIRRALAPGGRAAFWSAGEDRPFEQSLRRAGFSVEVRKSRAHAHARQELHRVYLADVPTDPAPPDDPEKTKTGPRR